MEENEGQNRCRNRSCHETVKKQLRNRFPILSWLPSYKLTDLSADIIAGVTVGLTVVPQSLAYAAIAGLSPEFGLYSSYIGCFLYVILGSCKQVTIGPTAVMGLLTYETCGNDFPSCAILTGFYSGIFELLMATLQLGWVVSFISESVVVGFTAGAATTIISSQIKSFLGLSGPKGSGFTGYWHAIFRDISSIKLGDCCMGIISFIVLFLLRKLKDYKHPETSQKKAIDTFCWFVSVSRNVIIVVITSCIAYLWSDPPFKLTGHVHGGFPNVGIPSFGLPFNSTAEEKMTYWETWSFIGAGPLVVSFIAILQNVAISKAFGSVQTVDATQEMYALGISNVIGSFFSSIPISGSFSRSAVNEASGVKSTMGGLFTGILVILSLRFLSSSFYFIPKSSLSAIIISAVMFMIEYEALPTMWRVNKMDAGFCLLTYFCALFMGMEYGIMIGVGTSLAVLLIKMLRPQLNPRIIIDESVNVTYILAKPDPGVYFPSVDYIRTSITNLSRKHEAIYVIALNLERWQSFDYTVITALVSLSKVFRKENKMLIFLNLSFEWENALKAGGLSDILHSNEQDFPDLLLKCSLEGVVSNSKINDGILNTNNASKSQHCVTSTIELNTNEVAKPLL